MSDAILRDQAVAHIKATTISYAEWAKRVKTGKYSPKDGSGTEWGKALASLSQIGTLPPPPTSSRLSFIHYSDGSVGGWKNLTSYNTGILNLNSDGVSVPCRSVTYSDPTSIPIGYDDCVTYATAQANNWIIQVVSSQWGQIAVPDMRIAAYRTEFCQSAVRFTKVAKRDGMHCDNVGVYQPIGDDYPGFRDAMVALIHELGDTFRAANLYLIANVNGFSSKQPDLGDQTNGDSWVNWAKLLQPGLKGFGCEFEYWGMPANGDQRPRLQGSNWDQQWDAWQTTPKRIEALGMDFYGVTYGPPTLLQYGYASLLAASDKAQFVVSLPDNSDPWGVVPAVPKSWSVNPLAGTATVS